MERFAIAVRRSRMMPGQMLPDLEVPSEVLQALATFSLIRMWKTGVYLLTARGYEAAWNAPDVVDMVDGKAVL